MIRLLKEDDKQTILEYLHRNEIETSFLYANVIEFGVDNKKDVRRCADYFGFFKDGNLAGIIPFYNLGSCIPHYETQDAITPFISLIQDRSTEFLMGMDRIIRPIYQYIKDTKDIAECNESSYFVNKDFKPHNISDIKFIDPQRMADDKGVIEFIIRVRNNGFHESVSYDDVKKSLSLTSHEADKVIAVKDGKMVAYANIQTYTDTINQIGSVYTVEEERGKGYCKAVVSELCKRIIFRKKIPTLFVKKNNIPAVKAYSTLGFEHFDDYLLIKLNTDNPDSP